MLHVMVLFPLNSMHAEAQGQTWEKDTYTTTVNPVLLKS